MDLIFANNAVSSLAGSIANTATTCQLQAGTGILFPQPVSNQYFVGTFTDAGTGLLNEIIWCTQVTGDTLTIQRGKENTQPQAWSANDLFAELWTAGQAGMMLQQGQNQFQTSNYAVDIGVANAYRVVLNPALAQPVAGMPIRVKITNTNTGPSTLDPGPGAGPVVTVLGLPLTGGELQAGMVVEFFWNGVSYNLQQPTVGAGSPTGMVAPFAGNVAPAGWLRCDGQAVGRTAFSALFTVIGIAYGSGDGTTTFNVPDLRGRVVAHLDGTAGRLTTMVTPNGNTLGAAGGQQQESAAVSVTALAGTVDVSVTVSVNVGTSGSTGGSLLVSGATDLENQWVGCQTGGAQVTSHPHAHSITNLATSGSLAVNTSGSGSGSGGGAGSIRGGTGSGSGTTATVSNVQPTLVLLYMIKA
jgi:microcystin-dependent protein